LVTWLWAASSLLLFDSRSRQARIRVFPSDGWAEFRIPWVSGWKERRVWCTLIFHDLVCWRIFKFRLDDKRLVQLTDGPWDDFDPCLLPSGRIVFTSTDGRRSVWRQTETRPVAGNDRCTVLRTNNGPQSTYTLPGCRK
jgi:hypothetical protein